VTFASGAKRNEDADGPNEFHVVLVDNGRSEIFGGPAHDVLKCIRCGACLNHCPVYGAIGGHAYGNVYPGPIGAALDPALDGIGNAHHLPNASSFCGRCEDVCPVKIPLTHIMRHWRNKAFEDGLNPAGLSWGLKIWGRLARSPRLYRVAAAFAARTIALLAGRKNTLGSAPIGRGWFKTRDLPVPPRKSFQTQWRARNK
jgi:L-lactate dehydrogenase complex protein LldF